MTLKELLKDAKDLAKPERAKTNEWFFKTGRGEYGEGDIFIGLTTPDCRKLSRQYKTLELKDLKTLINSKIHEKRLIGLFILRIQYEQTKEESEQKKLTDFYLKNRNGVNNWDLVDSSAHYILGDYLRDRDKSILYKFAESKNLWERRIAIISTFDFIKHSQFEDTLKITEILLQDKHDLIHKAVGWMLREIGNRDLPTEEKFLKKHYQKMPRTMLCYAIEKFPEPKRQAYLKGKI